VEVLMADLVEADLLEMMKDGSGHFYRPDYNFNNIPGWSVNEGYQVKMRDYAEVRLVGWTVLREEPIGLESGWQIVSYYPNFPIEASLALSRIEDNLVIAKDGYGNFYIPAWDYSNMGDMRAGRGYYVNVDENVQLVYVFENEEAITGNVIRQPSVYAEPGSLPVHSQTGSNMSLLVHADPSLAGDIGVFASGNLVGSGVLQDGICGIAVWGDDLTTDIVDGAVEGEPLELKLLCDGNLNPVSYSLLSGKDVYNQDALSVIRLTESVELPDEYAIVSAYPNPFNSLMKVSYNLPEAANVKLNVFDLAGRFVAELANGRRQAGIYTTTFDGSDLASGIYMIRFEAGGHALQYKVTLVK
ncbi:MAG: T9SS type A sorting domain-containing protein, partial [Candidatus Hatepunaea meridiana]|nr:T9SS type A sorting domain-containing protein [Candidatus Hatepunaea meridiana]